MVVNLDMAKQYNFLWLKTQVLECISKKTHPYSTDAVAKLFESYPGSDVERRATVDQAFRDQLKLYQSKTASCYENASYTSDDQKSASILHYEDLINLVILHAQEKYCTKNLPILLLGDIFDTLTLKDCEIMFNFVEQNVAIWTAEPFFSTGKNHLLRMCNDILRRLSKSQNTIFCGRIQLFLAQLFPVEEKSALNLMSNFHVENVTLYKTNQLEFEDMSIDGTDAEEGELVANTVDYNLYVKFWSLQNIFSNPPKCYTATGWNKTTENITEVLKAFDSFKLEPTIRKRKSTEPTNISDISTNIETYFAKYLTNEKLLNLQLNDSNFRRYFLVQVLILFQYLTGTVKFKTPPQVLNDNQISWINQTSEKVYSSLCETPPNGKRFSLTVKHILNREENWINWKNDACPSFAKSNVKSDDEKESATKKKKRCFGDDYMVQNNQRKINIGTAELTRLWNLNPDNLASCKAENRLKFLPNLEEFFEEAIEQADPEAGIEDEYKLVKQPSFQWRALRLLARRSHHFFTPSSTPFKALPEYLNSVIENISKDIQKSAMEVKAEGKHDNNAENGEVSATSDVT